MDKNIKIIFTDLDWTLFDHHQVDYVPSGLSALERARKNGVKVIICTSRSYMSLHRVEAFKRIPYDGYICSNGGVAYADNKYVFRHHLDNELVKSLLKEFDERHLVAQLISYDQSFLVKEEDELASGFYKYWLEYHPSVKPYNNEEITSILLFAKPHDEDFLVDYPVYQFRFYDGGLDITPFPYLKGEAVKQVLDYYGFKKEEAVAIGDDIADIEMFKEVKYGVAMGNGKQETKDAAYLVTDNIDDDGLEKALIKLGIIDE